MNGDLIWRQNYSMGHIGARYVEAEKHIARIREEQALIDALRVERDPCTYCGVRADVGCRHR